MSGLPRAVLGSAVGGESQTRNLLITNQTIVLLSHAYCLQLTVSLMVTKIKAFHYKLVIVGYPLNSATEIDLLQAVQIISYYSNCCKRRLIS